MTSQSALNGAGQWMVKILKIAEEDSINAQNIRTRQIRIDFMVGPHGPFVERFTKESFDPNSANQALMAFAAKLQQLNG